MSSLTLKTIIQVQNSCSNEYTFIVGAVRIAQHRHNHAQASVVVGHGVVRIALAADSAMMKSCYGENDGHE